MNKCSHCKKMKSEVHFEKNGRMLKTCSDCRNLSRKWRCENKERVKQYNKMNNNIIYNNKIKHENRKKTLLLAQKLNTNEWIKFDTYANAAKQLNVYTSNIYKVINGTLKQTGGYIFKRKDIERELLVVPTWNQIKNKYNFEHKTKGKPAKHRVKHEKVGNIMGKKCCTCKTWRALSHFNYDKSHWDNLRVDCKTCLSNWRKGHRHELNARQSLYTKKRKKNDLLFKLVVTTRSRLLSALKTLGIPKKTNTIKYLGCSILFFKRYMEVQFLEGMNWNNHGKVWDIDHIIPISYEKCKDENEVSSRFHWSNCQPMWRNDNMSKKHRYISFNDNTILTKQEYIKYRIPRLLLILGRIGLCYIVNMIACLNTKQFQQK